MSASHCCGADVLARFAAVLLLLVAGSACEDRAAPPARAVAAATAWSVAATPLLSIGEEERADYQFHDIGGFGRLATGGWVVFDRGALLLRYYDESGAFVRRAGGRGEGPGEFRNAQFMTVRNGTDVYTYDQMLRRLYLWSADGALVTTWNLFAPMVGSVLQPVGVADGRTAAWMNFATPACVSGELWNVTNTYYVSRTERRPGRASDVVPESLTPVHTAPGMMHWGSAANVLGRCLPTVVPFAPGPLATVAADRLVIAARSGVDLIRYDLRGGGSTRLRVPVPRRPLTQPVIDAYIAAQLSTVPRDETGRELPHDRGWQLYAQRLKELPYPDSMPAIDQLVVDTEGYVWLRHYHAAGDTASTWTVVNDDGVVVATLVLPPRMRVTEIGANHIAGVLFDSLDVQRAIVLSLRRPDRAPSLQ